MPSKKAPRSEPKPRPAAKPRRVFCHITGKNEDASFIIERFCRFYAGQPYKPSLGNLACHEQCTVPRRFEVPGLAKADET